MFFRIPRLTPGYIRYLQTQAAQTMLQNHEGSAMPRVAILLGLMGVAMSGYSSRQLTLHHKPSELFQLFQAHDTIQPNADLLFKACHINEFFSVSNMEQEVNKNTYFGKTHNTHRI
uniref:Uncharacterized protein n=1 Tax=Nothobranchius furzeri TaxID=105023 RepID=A0A8C6LG16_NOTFU